MQARDFKLQLLGKLHRDLTPEPGPPDRQRQFRRVLRASGVWQAAEIAHRIKLPGRLRQKKHRQRALVDVGERAELVNGGRTTTGFPLRQALSRNASLLGSLMDAVPGARARPHEQFRFDHRSDLLPHGCAAPPLLYYLTQSTGGPVEKSTNPSTESPRMLSAPTAGFLTVAVNILVLRVLNGTAPSVITGTLPASRLPICLVTRSDPASGRSNRKNSGPLRTGPHADRRY